MDRGNNIRYEIQHQIEEIYLKEGKIDLSDYVVVLSPKDYEAIFKYSINLSGQTDSVIVFELMSLMVVVDGSPHIISPTVKRKQVSK